MGISRLTDIFRKSNFAEPDNEAFGLKSEMPEVVDKKSILFVCLYNICRSPAAKQILQRYIAQHKLKDSFHIDSAGVTRDPKVKRPSYSLLHAARQRGYVLTGLNSRRVMRTDLNRFDIVIAMDRRVMNELRQIHSNPKSDIRLLSEFLPEPAMTDVADPMNRSVATCNKVLDMLELACPSLVESALHSSTGTSRLAF